jgi:hypothetical protein
MIGDRLKIPIKHQGYLDMYNGIDILQTCYYIKINLKTFIDKIFEPYLATWMKTAYPSPARSTLLLSDPTWLKKFKVAVGDPDKKLQAQLAKTMQLNYRSGVGELIWAMTTCPPDLSYASVKLSQSNSCPHELHFHGLKHALKFLYHSRDDSLYFWRTGPCMELPEGPIPPIQIATNRASFSTIAPNSMIMLHMHILTLTGQLVSKHDVRSVASAFASLVARSHINANSNRRLPVLLLKQNLWPPTTRVR